METTAEIYPQGVFVNAKTERAQGVFAEPAAQSPLEVAFTIAKGERPVSKTYGIGKDGMPEPLRGAGMSEGAARRVVLRGATATEVVTQMADKLSGLARTEALILVPPPAGQDEWPVVTKDQVGDRTDVIARSQRYFRHTAGASLLGLDFDAKGYPRHIKERLLKLKGRVSGALTDVFPAFASAAYVSRPSVSCGIKNTVTGQTTDQYAGFHRYYVAVDGLDCAAFAKRLAEHLMLAGWGWGEVSESGSILERTLIDVSATSGAERFWYEADAVLGAAVLEYLPEARKSRLSSGGLLDTRELPELTAEEAERLAQIKKEIAAKLEPERAAKRAAWLAERGKVLEARGVKADIAARVLAKAAETHVLTGDFPIVLDSGETVTVADILANRQKYQRRTCADPLEPDYGGGKNKAVVYTDGRPHIHSLAHGGIEYILEQDASAFFTPAEPEATNADAGGWSEPVDVFGDGDPSALMDVPAGALPPVIERYSRDVAERMGAPVASVAFGAIVVASAAIGGKLRIQPKAHDTGWQVPPFLWGILVEEPGGKKSPIISAVTAPLNNVDARWAKVDVPKRNAWDLEARKRKKDAPTLAPRPRVRRAVVDSFTVEGLRDVLADNPRGVLVSADEVTGLIGSLDQYKTAGGSDRADLLKLTDGHARTIDRVGRSIRIDCWGAAVLGGIQPRRMAEIARGLDPDGLLQRFTPIVGDNVRRDGVDRAPDHVAARDYTSAIESLAESDYGGLFDDLIVTLSSGAQEVRQRFERRINALLDLPQMADAWRNHVSKWGGTFSRLLLVFHMLEHGVAGASIAVSADTAERVWRFAQFLLAHAILFYETVVGRGPAGEAARIAAGVVLVLGKPVVSQRDLYEKHRAWRPNETPHEMLEGMQALCRLGWCAPAESNSSGVTTSWKVNPFVFQRFSARAEAETERRRREYARVQQAVAERREIKTAAPNAPCVADGRLR